MKKSKVILGTSLSAVLLVTTLALVACGGANGEKLYNEKCSDCHSLDLIKSKGYSGEADWTQVVTDMVEVYDANFDEDEQKAVIEYLVSQDA